MLDDLHPPARLLAQMRAITARKKLPDGFADVLASRAGMTALKAEAVAEPMRKIVELGEAAQIAVADLIEVASEALAEIEPGDDAAADAKAFFERGKALLAAKWKQGGDIDIPMHGAPTAHGYTGIGMSWDSGPGLRAKQSDALASLVCAQLGLKHTPTMGREFLRDDVASTKLMLARASANAHGYRPRDDSDATKAWMSGTTSTSDFPLAAASSTEIVVARALEQQPIGLREVVHVVPASDWRARNHVGLSGSNVFESVGEGGEAKFLTVDENGEVLAAPDRKAGFFRATDRLIRNAGRSMDLELALARAMIEGANETMRATVAAKILTTGNLADGVAVFDASRGNLAGTASTPDVTALSGARTGLERLTDSQGVPRPVEPGIILVAPENRTEAERLVAELTAAEVAEVNPFSGRLRVVSDPGLTDAAWFVLGDPARFDGLALILLDDMLAPRIEAQPAWPTFGFEWRAQWPMACSWVRPSWYRTPTA